MNLSPEQSKTFDDYERMFATDGWKMFIEDMKKNKESLIGMLMQPDANSEVLWFAKGRNDVYDTVIGLQSMVEQVRKAIEESSDE